MFSLKRNQIIITVLVFMIAVAAYLNTQQPISSVNEQLAQADTVITEPEEVDFFEGYNEQLLLDNQNAVDDQNAVADETQVNLEEEATETLDDQIAMADATVTDTVSATITKKAEETLDSNVPVSTSLEVDYFAEEKLLRDQSRAQQIDQLTEYVSNESIDQDIKAEAAANLIEIQERIEKETSAEALLKAKGFEEVYVRIDDDTVDVVVNKAELTDTDIAQIEEIVNRKTGYSVGKINITPLNGVAKN